MQVTDMQDPVALATASLETGDFLARYQAIRARTLEICEPLENEDFGVQPMDDASPPKWHLAHVTWFFETFVLKPFMQGYVPYNDSFEALFNSYYNGVGKPFPRSRRGTLSRPTVRDVMDYRQYVDEKMSCLSGELEPSQLFRIVLGLNHEQQHQELLFTDIKYNLGHNPMRPPYRYQPGGVEPVKTVAMDFVPIKGGVHAIGSTGDGFAFDNESPRHEVLLADYMLGDRLVTNGEYLEFMVDGGYQKPELWLSDGWSLINDPHKGFSAPLYWEGSGDDWFIYTLTGLKRLDMHAPVCHVSAYEADAYARWKGARLPTEAEWEVAAATVPVVGNFVESKHLHPVPSPSGSGIGQLFGDVWEWTQSSYAPYPGFRTFGGQLGEYNGKFMANQLVLRGGSCVTPTTHIRPGYRNFFYPGDRWQFSGIRLAR